VIARYGEALFEARGVKRDRAKAIELFEKAAALKYGRAETDLGIALFQGDGIPVDYRRSADWLRQGSHDGDALAEDFLGQIAEKGLIGEVDTNEAYTHYLAAAVRGSFWGVRNMARLASRGLGADPKPESSTSWFLRVSQVSDPDMLGQWGELRSEGAAIDEVLSDLADAYRKGTGVPKDEQKADQSLQRAIALESSAAALGWPRAQFYLGARYASGEGVRQDYSKAMYWYRKAAEQDNNDAETRIGQLYRDGRSVKQDYTEAMVWLQKGADHGNVHAQYSIGYMYLNGNGVPKDYSFALMWFKKSADQGYDLACYWIGRLLANGQGAPVDYAKAIGWRRRRSGS
jgi:uncharacterized protein